MKKIIIGMVCLAFAFNFTSCTKNDSTIDMAPQPLLQKYKVSKDAEGHYFLDYKVADQTEVTMHKDITTLTNQIYLSKVDHKTNETYQNDLSIDNDKLKVNFFDTATNNNQLGITVFDDKIKLGKGVESSKYLKNYSITSNSDKTYELEFEVRGDVKTDFVFDDVTGTYEVHLSKGQSSQSSFTRTLLMPDTGQLKLTFVNHIKKFAKGQTLDTTLGEIIVDKPVVIIDG